MTKIPPRKKKGIGSHYAYLGGGKEMRKVTKVFNLTNIPVKSRRKLIHDLIELYGECLAILPPGFEHDCDLEVLEQYLEGEL